jgi:hypothetical protein
MADFKTKVITLAGMATMFAGMAFGQAALSGTGVVTSGAIFIRAEGATELLPPTTITITNTVPSTAASVTFTVYLAPSLTITSQVVSKVSEASACIGIPPCTGAVTAGTVTGSTVTFTSVPISAAPASTTITIEGIRVNSGPLATGSGIPQGVSEQVFLQGSSGVVTPGATAPTIVAYATNGLVNTGTSAVNVTSVSPAGTVCGGIAANGFTINLSEGFVGAFKTLAQEASPIYAATTGTGLSITFANVPSTVAIYLPLTIGANVPVTTPPTVPVGFLTLVVAPTSPATGTNLVAASTAKGVPALYGAVTIANGTGTAYYEVTGSNSSSVDSYAISPYEINAAGSLSVPASAMTATVSLAPSIAAGATPATYPSFVGANTQQTITGNAFAACSTSLLFPFVTNQAGFETGIAIANTSSDLLSSKAANSVTAQAGTCLLTFFGGSTNPVSYTTPTVATGTDWTATLTSVTGGTPNTFGGYMIAQCNFLYAHGFSYITYNIGAPNAMAMGYLALELTRGVTTTPESLNN